MTKKYLIIDKVNEQETDCEIIWCKINIHGFEQLLIGAYYRPKEDNANSLAELETSLNRIDISKDHIILVFGDFNFPGRDWGQKQIKTNCHYPILHQKFGDLLDDKNIDQVVEEPTGDKATLDLIITNQPAKINRVEVIPGISDHDIPLVEVDVSPIGWKQTPRNITLYSKAKWDNIREELEGVA